MATLSDLRTLQTAAQIRARIVAQLQAGGLPVNDWTPSAAGGVENIVLDGVAKTLAKLIAPKVSLLAKMGFLHLAEGDALTINARKRYKLERNLATYTIQNVVLTSVPSAPYYKFRPGDVIVKGAGGNLYRNLDPIELRPGDTHPPPGGKSRFQADQPGASYSDAPGTITRMVTAPAGVSCVNLAASDFEPTTVSGPSSGTITPLTGVGRFAVAAPIVRSVRIRIDSDGEIGTATGSFAFDEDGWTPLGPIPELFSLPGATPGSVAGILAFANGTPPSFVKGDIFTLLVSDAILQRGADEESDESLRQRCRYRWASLSDVPVGGLVSLWCQLASPEVHRVRVDADPDLPGGMLVAVASQGGPASPAAVIAVQDYITARLGYRGMPAPSTRIANSPEETVRVTSAKAFPVTPTGTVQVPRAKLREVQEKADKLWGDYLAKLDLGGTIIYPELIQAVMDAGAVDAVDPVTKTINLRINGGTSDIQLAGNQVAVPADGVTLTNTLVWQAV